ncbi:MAG: hypothetical protein ACRD0A_11345 [Acidimicrobiales bacterium]
MTNLPAAAEPAEWAVGVAGLAFGLAGIWVGVLAWQGRYPGPAGPRPPYQSFFGVAHAAAPIGATFALLSLGELVRGAAGLDRDGPLFLTISVVVFVGLVVTVVYVLAYYWVGVPAPLRPPYQREHE